MKLNFQVRFKATGATVPKASIERIMAYFQDLKKAKARILGMGLLDFKEIPEANSGNGLQDTFELFAREFFVMQGFEILENPDRGPDGGRDLIVSETRSGTLGDTKVKWLVSCKHKAHSGKSVTENDEQDISGRVESFGCDGFIGFYSTIQSSGLNKRLEGFRSRFEIRIFDHEQIERVLLDSNKSHTLLERFFPLSYKKQRKEIKPSKIYSDYYPLKCECCGKDLLTKDLIKSYSGLIGFVLDMDYFHASSGKQKYTGIYCACKGECDRKMEHSFSGHYITQWSDISDLAIPNEYLKWIIGIMNEIRSDKTVFTDETYEKWKDITLTIAQVVMREPTVSEIERTIILKQLPDGV